MTSRELLSLAGSRRPPPGLGGRRRGLPPYDHAEITSLAAATIVYELVSLIGARRRAGDV